MDSTSRPSQASDIEIRWRCEDCGQMYDATAQARVSAFVGAGLRRPRYCPECREKRVRAEEVQREVKRAQSLNFYRDAWLRTSGIPELYRDKGWDDFEPRWKSKATGKVYDNRARMDALRRWAAEFPTDGYYGGRGYPSLVIASKVNGVGKTHLACAMLKDIIMRAVSLEHERSPFMFVSAGDLRRRAATAQRFDSKETVQDVYKHLGHVPLLVLDDVGKERLSGNDAAMAYEVYYSLLNARYNARLPIVVTSNLGLAPWEEGGISLVDVMGTAGVSRLREMTPPDMQQIVLDGEDRRGAR